MLLLLRLLIDSGNTAVKFLMVQKSHRYILFLFIYYFSYFYKDSNPSKYKAKHDITKESC